MNIRTARPESDFPRIVDLVNLYERLPISLTQFHKWDEFLPPGRTCRRMVAVNNQDQVAGYSQTSHETWYPPGHFYIWVITDPNLRGQGLGSVLFEEAQVFLREQGAVSQESEVRDDDPVSLKFAEKRGFEFQRHKFGSILDITMFDEKPYLEILHKLEMEGVRFFSLADMGDTMDARRKQYEVNYETVLDIPGAKQDWFSFEQFVELVCHSDWYRPEGQFAASIGETWVGLSAVQLLPEEKAAYNLMTGVRKPYRGRKIAQALKFLAIRYARENGARFFRTDNDSLNESILAINRKLGYKPEPGKYVLWKG